MKQNCREARDVYAFIRYGERTGSEPGQEEIKTAFAHMEACHECQACLGAIKQLQEVLATLRNTEANVVIELAGTVVIPRPATAPHTIIH